MDVVFMQKNENRIFWDFGIWEGATFWRRFFALKEWNWRLLVMTIMKDNFLNFQKIGRNLKFDHGKALKNGDKVSHVLEPKCDFWDICDIWIHLLGNLWLLVFVPS